MGAGGAACDCWIAQGSGSGKRLQHGDLDANAGFIRFAA
jgi:hypothetical protein